MCVVRSWVNSIKVKMGAGQATKQLDCYVVGCQPRGLQDTVALVGQVSEVKYPFGNIQGLISSSIEPGQRLIRMSWKKRWQACITEQLERTIKSRLSNCGKKLSKS